MIFFLPRLHFWKKDYLSFWPYYGKKCFKINYFKDFINIRLWAHLDLIQAT